jgi:hypothetical protein
MIMTKDSSEPKWPIHIVGIALGLLGAGIGGAWALLRQKDPGPDFTFLVVFVFGCGGGFAGGMIGLVLGFLFSWLWLIGETDMTRVASDGPQLVGQQCAGCGKELSSILDGKFCRDCSRPVHNKCVRVSFDGDLQCCPGCVATLGVAL